MDRLWPLLAGVALAVILRPIFVSVRGQVRDWWRNREQPSVAVPISATIAGSVLVLAMLIGACWIVFDTVERVVADTNWLTTVATLTPEATGLAAIVALTIGWFTILQKTQTDRRDQWWKRAQWALELALDPAAEKESKEAAGIRRRFALQVLQDLAASPLASTDDARLVGEVDGKLVERLNAKVGITEDESAEAINYESGNDNPTVPENGEG